MSRITTNQTDLLTMEPQGHLSLATLTIVFSAVQISHVNEMLMCLWVIWSLVVQHVGETHPEDPSQQLLSVIYRQHGNTVYKRGPKQDSEPCLTTTLTISCEFRLKNGNSPHNVGILKKSLEKPAVAAKDTFTIANTWGCGPRRRHGNQPHQKCDDK